METSMNIPAKSSLAWPGDVDLLNYYGVTTAQIADEFSKIINEVIIKEKLLEPDSDPDVIGRGLYSIVGKYKVTGEVFYCDEGINKVKCAYCKQMFPNKINFIIENINNKEKLFVPDIMEHLVKEHGDLGDSGSKYRITPTRVCKTFELGDTYLPEDHPLFEVAKYSYWTPNQIDQKKIDDATLKELNTTSKQIADRINGLIKLGERQSNNKLYFHEIIGNHKIDWDGAGMSDGCPLDEAKTDLPYYEGKITNQTTKKWFPITYMMIYTIEKYGYFAREGTQNRIDPKLAYEVLDFPNEIVFQTKI